MNQIWGAVLIIFTLFAWLGQSMSRFFPKIAQRLSLTEPEVEVDPAFWADVRGEALWDTLILWTLPVAGILLFLSKPVWVYFGLVGGGMYLYFAGRGILTRMALRRRGIRIGTPKTLAEAYAFLAIWGLIAIVTIYLAVAAFPV